MTGCASSSANWVRGALRLRLQPITPHTHSLPAGEGAHFRCGFSSPRSHPALAVLVDRLALLDRGRRAAPIATQRRLLDPKRPQPQLRHHGARLYLGVPTSSTIPEALPPEAHSVSPARRAGRRDRSGRLEGDTGIVEQYKNPSKALALPRAPGRQASPAVRERPWPSARGQGH